MGVGNALAELRAPGQNRKIFRQAISPEHNALAEVSTQTQSKKLLLPFPMANSSLTAALPWGRSAPAKGRQGSWPQVQGCPSHLARPTSL